MNREAGFSNQSSVNKSLSGSIVSRATTKEDDVAFGEEDANEGLLDVDYLQPSTTELFNREVKEMPDLGNYESATSLAMAGMGNDIDELRQQNWNAKKVKDGTAGFG